ncbi:MAG: transporter substrate-binding protein, partial [Gammaproteobacteria bacterium]|nr:transporter substrate-binding protein [Gammaproteobacteria bacterium]
HFGPRMFFAGNNYEWPRGSIDAAKRALERIGGTHVGEEYCPIGVESALIEQLLDHVEAAAPDVFVPYFAGTDQVNLLTRFTRRGLKQKMAVVMGHYDEMMASKLPADVREGFYSSNTYFMTIDSAANRDYLARLVKLPGVSGIWPKGNGILTNFGEGAYICVKAFAQAANSAGSVDADALIDALKSICVSGPQGEVRMDSTTHHASVNTYLSHCQTDGSFAIVDTFGSIDPKLPERYDHQRISHQATLEDDIRLQARMLEQMSEAVLLSNSRDGTIIYSNAGAERMLGYQKGELLGSHFTTLYSSENNPVADQTANLAEILSTNGAWEGELEFIKKQGDRIWCSVTVSTFTHPVYGEVWMGVCRNISQLKQLQQELEGHREHLEGLVATRTAALEEAKNDAVRANVAKSKFLSQMSHELRTPMNAILGFAQVLEQEPIGTEPVQYAREILQAGQHLLELINELLDLSRIEAGKMQTQIQAVSVSDVIQEALTYTRVEMEKQNITVQVRCTDDMAVLADPIRLRQILINLTSNATKYNYSGGQIEVFCEQKNNHHLRISIKDTGPGLTPEQIQRLFQPFERLGAESGSIEGTGIGLALTKQLTLLMNGVIGVDSVVGQGSTFWCEFPLTQKKTVIATPSDAPTSQNHPQFDVLYIEDNAANLRLVEAMLRNKTNIRLLSAINGKQGLELVNRYLPAVILLDIRLPDMDGYAILKTLRADRRTSDIPVIALSADAMPIDIERGQKAGFNNYLTKPINANLLVETLERIFSKLGSETSSSRKK